jgi:very-short-patch-repair endonuclease
MLPYSRNLKEPARTLRKRTTDAENVLWSRLRRKQVLDVQFYRQKPIGPYIVDFYAPAAKLVIEVDGCQHHEEEHRKRDDERDATLAVLGIKVVRFDNIQVIRNTDGVLEAIFEAVTERLAGIDAVPQREG